MIRSLLLISVMSISLFGCNGIEDEYGEQTSEKASFAYSSMIKWDGHVYVVTETSVGDVGQKIGEIEIFEDYPTLDTPNNSSNKLPVGTELYEIRDTDPGERLAVKNEEGGYVEAVWVNIF